MRKKKTAFICFPYFEATQILYGLKQSWLNGDMAQEMLW